MTTTLLILLMGIVLIVTNLKIQNDVLTKEMELQATEIAERWGKMVDPVLVEQAAEETEFDGEAHTELMELFDEISKYIPNVAQGYLFSSTLTAGNETAIIANPTHLVELLKENGIKNGDLHEHPETIAKEIRKLNETKKTTASEIYDDLFGTWITVLYPITDDSGEVFAFFGVDVDASMVKNGTNKFLMSSLLVLIPAIALIVLIQVFITRKNFRPLKQLLEGINEMRTGNLDIALPTREDDLGQMNAAFNDMADELKTMITHITQTSETVLQSSELVKRVSEQSIESSIEINESINQMSVGIQAQEVAVSESAGGIEQIAVEISSIATSSNDVTTVSRQMEEFAEQGLTIIGEVVSQMDVINNTVKKSSGIIGSLKDRSDEISSILDVITGISKQTNLLALNAAIEAARAGEHGKGFAVVAQEVRKLAEESSKSTEKISKIIEEIHNETNSAVSAMAIGTTEAEKGSKIAEETGELFNKIKVITDQISNQIEGVSAATQEISAGTEEVTASVKDLTEIAKNNSTFANEIESSTKKQLASINQLADASIELNELAHELQSTITKFKA